MMKGKRKCKLKNNFKVKLLIANPHHIHLTNNSPNKGMTLKRFVITVAPHIDIWPQGKTYPKNATPIKRI